MPAGDGEAADLRAELARLGAPRGRVRALDVKVMLAETRDGAFAAPGWLFELKYDGFRVVAGREDGTAQLVYRRGGESTAVFPEVARTVSALPYDRIVLDGEVVCLDEGSRPSFQRLQRRALLQRTADIQRAALDLPATYFVFDLLGFEDFDLRPLPLRERKRLLERLLPREGPIRFVDHIEAAGTALFEEVRRQRLEGIVAKRAELPYRGGRSDGWLKIRVDRTADFVVVGFTLPDGSRLGLGALHLGQYRDGELLYSGRAGSGFSDDQLLGLRKELEHDRRATPAVGGPLPRGPEHVWVEPRLVAEVRYKEWTEEHLLRQPVFLRFRADKPMHDCVRETPAPALDAIRQETDDLRAFYERASPWLLPYLRDRPLVASRIPDGARGERLWSEHAGREVECLIADDIETLREIAAIGPGTLGVWASRMEDLARPDWCLLDLQAGDAPFRQVVRVARALHELAGEMEVPSLVKTNGLLGLHVLVPLGGQCTFEQARSLAELMARVIAERLRGIATTARTAAIGGRVCVDFRQNVLGSALAAPFSVLPSSGGLVATPLAWDEVDEDLSPLRFTVGTVPERLERAGADPLAPVLTERPDLSRALGRLAERLAR
jgi:bifunctional non-homologous end joining protein LigD